MDSTPPSRPDEVPLGRRSARPTLAPQHPEYAAQMREGRMALLEAELERLRSERASEADETAGMLVHIAESERMRASAQFQAVEAGERAGALEGRLEHAQRRIDELEVELAGARSRWAASQAELTSAKEQLGSMNAQLASAHAQLTSVHAQVTSANEQLAAARESMASALEMVEEMERREEMAASMRTRGLRDAARTLGRGDTGPAPERVSVAPESTVEIVGTHDVDWDLEVGE